MGLCLGFSLKLYIINNQEKRFLYFGGYMKRSLNKYYIYIYNLDYTLKAKEEGRNVDINVANINDYKKFKREKEVHKKKLQELNNKVTELEAKSNHINDLVDNLKPIVINKKQMM